MEEMIMTSEQRKSASTSIYKNILMTIASDLLKEGFAQYVIGYAEGTSGRVRPVFVRKEEEIDKLVFDKRCTFNLAVYLYKKEIANFGKPAIVANVNTLRSIMRLASENQIKDGNLVAITENASNEIIVLNDFQSIENYLAEQNLGLGEKDKAMIEKIDAMSAAERWAFWQNEFAKCIKCYACRQACPLCYCTTCTVEQNQPQWITVASSKVGNLEWHLSRTMHLAGRCTTCGQCASVCPMDIPLHLLPIKLSEEFKEMYGSVSGVSRNENCAMSTFKPDDKESFIG
jgi:formate dehydrogenase (coenzyme F420) beta subunit